MPPDPSDTRYEARTDVSSRVTSIARAVLSPAARQDLCDRYAPVVFTGYHAFFRGRPNARADALDLTHEFVAHYFLEPTAPGVYRFAVYLTQPPDDRGRFLAYTRLAAENFRIDQHRRDTNQERGGGWRRVEVDADPDRFADFLVSKRLGPDEEVERAYTLSLLSQAARRVVARLTARPDDGVELGFYDALAADRLPDFRALAARWEKSDDAVRKGWGGFRADRALAPYLLTPPPPFADLARALGAPESALRTRFTRLRTPLRVELQRIMADELEAADPVRAAAEVTRLLDALGRLTEGA